MCFVNFTFLRYHAFNVDWNILQINDFGLGMDGDVCSRVFDYKFSTAREKGASTEEANGMKFSGGAAQGKLCGFG